MSFIKGVLLVRILLILLSSTPIVSAIDNAEPSCPSGWRLKSNWLSNTCEPCPRGHYCTNPQQAAMPCHPGTFQDEEGNTHCKPCAPGHVSEGMDHESYLSQTLSLGGWSAKECVPCPQGHSCSLRETSPHHTWVHELFNAGVRDFIHGKVSEFEDETDNTESSENYNPSELRPIPCEKGKYQNEEGQTECKQCPPGKYTLQSGSCNCSICPRGYFCPNSQQEPQKCSIGSYSPEGATHCTLCPAQSFCPKPFLDPYLPLGWDEGILNISSIDFYKLLVTSNQSYNDGPEQGKAANKILPDPDILQVYNSTYDSFGLVKYDEELDQIQIAFRGTVITSTNNILSDIDVVREALDIPGCSTCTVHSGFLNAYRSVRDQVHTALEDLLIEHKILAGGIMFTGHSLGAAMATLALGDYVYLGIGSDTTFSESDGEIPIQTHQVGLVTFGSPRVGNEPFAQFINDLLATPPLHTATGSLSSTSLESSETEDTETQVPFNAAELSSTIGYKPVNYRVTYNNDAVTTVPGTAMGFKHVGYELHFEDKDHSSVATSVYDVDYERFSIPDHHRYFLIKENELGKPLGTGGKPRDEL